MTSLVDAVAQGFRACWSTPAYRDIAAVAGVLIMLAAIALWKPLLGLFFLGAVIVVAMLLASFVATRVREEKTDGAG